MFPVFVLGDSHYVQVAYRWVYN